MGRHAVLRWAGAAFVVAVLLTGCGGGGSAPPTAVQDGSAAFDGPELAGTITLQAPRIETPPAGNASGRIALEWSDTVAAAGYSVWVSPRDGAPFAEVAAELTADPTGGRAVFDPSPTRQLDFPTAQVRVRGCDAAGACSDSNAQPLAEVLIASRPSLIPSVDPFSSTVGGSSVYAISDDGRTIAALRATELGMLGNPPENFSPSRVDVYTRTEAGNWTLVGLPTPDYTAPTSAMALSGDGRTLAISLLYSYGGYSSIGVPGLVVVYVREAGSVWRLQAVITAPPALGIAEQFGLGLALSDDGRRLAATARSVDTPFEPAVLVFDRQADDTWHHTGRLTGGVPTNRLAMSGNGELIAVPEGARGALVVRVFRRGCACGQVAWQPAGELSSDSAGDDFGNAGLAISDDGATIAVGAPAGGSAAQPGAVHVFVPAGAGAWQRQARLVNPGETASDLFGLGLALSGDGRVLAGSACGRFVEAAGVNRNYAASPPPLAEPSCRPDGAAGLHQGVQVYARDAAGAWVRTASVVPTLPPPVIQDTGPVEFRLSPLLSRDGGTLGIGAYRDSGQDHGVPGEAALIVY